MNSAKRLPRSGGGRRPHAQCPHWDARFRSLWRAREGGQWALSVTAIAELMGCSRSSAVRAARRLGLCRYGDAVKARAGGCLWPMGDVRADDFRLCDAPREPGRVYCAEHCGVAWLRRGR